MELELAHPPTPEYAPDHAQIAVEAARTTDGIVLDYSPSSLEHVEALLARFRTNGQGGDEVGSSVFVLACYVGEVFIREFGGHWTTSGESIAPPLSAREDESALVAEFGDGYFDRPVLRCFALLAGRAEQSILDFHAVVAANT